MNGNVQRIDRRRLHPKDLMHMVDWTREGWLEDERDVAVKIRRLEWHFLELPERFHAPALEQIDLLKRSRVVNGVDHEGALSRLARLASEWKRDLKEAA